MYKILAIPDHKVEDGSFIGPDWWIKNFGTGCLGDQDIRLPVNALEQYQDMKENIGQVLRLVYVPQYLIIDGKRVDLTVPVLADIMGSKAAFYGAKYSRHAKEWLLSQQKQSVRFTTYVPLAHCVIITLEPLRNSFNKNLQQVEDILTGINENCRFPTIREAVISLFSNTEATLQEWTRTTDCSSDGTRLAITFDGDGVRFLNDWGDDAFGYLGACVVQELPSLRKVIAVRVESLTMGISEKGTLSLPNGDYEGPIIDGKANGIGKLNLNKNSLSPGSIYMGEFKDDVMEGNGLLIYSDGANYDGQFEDGKPNGSGVFTDANGYK